MADYNLSKNGPPRWDGPGASGPPAPLNSAALRIRQAQDREYAEWYDALVAERFGEVQPPARRRTP